MLAFLLNALGRALAALPEGALAAACRALGWLVATLPGKRSRTLHANLHHAFPEKNAAWRRKIAMQSAARSIEMGVFVLVSPHFSRERLARHFTLHEGLLHLIGEYRKSPHPLIVLVPHFSLMEAVTLFPALASGPLPEVGVVYRPFDAPGLEDWVRRTRERFGLRLLSRKDGYFHAVDMLRKQGAVAVLFDQNAGERGALTLFFGRVCATSELGGLLAAKCRARCGFMYPERAGFLRAAIRGEYLECAPTADEIVFAANRWLENKLRESDAWCADWLWLHGRWRHQDEPSRRFRLQSKRNLLPEQLAWMGASAPPRRTRFWVRIPNWLGDVVMALPLLRALRRSRPDAEITLLAQPQFAPLLEKLGAGDRVLALPPQGPGYWKFFRALRGEFPDVQIQFTNSARGDIEARLAGAPQRFGMARPGAWRPLLTHVWHMPADLDETQMHQTRVWERFFRHFGLEGDLDFSPCAWPAQAAGDGAAPRIGFICGTENDPSKRWPVERWRELAERIFHEHPGAVIELFGTARDAEITRAVAAGFAKEKVRDHAGRTSLLEFADALRACAALVCNDTGGMHLANALGVPVVAVYGPTNPLRTGPVFDAPRTLLQPSGCPPTGGSPLALLESEQVFAALRNFIS